MDDLKIEVIKNPEVLSTLVGTEFDIQISTAKKYPRDLQRAMKTLRNIALSNVTITESCIYALARKQKNKQGCSSQGISIDLGQQVVGNARQGCYPFRVAKELKNQGPGTFIGAEACDS